MSRISRIWKRGAACGLPCRPAHSGAAPAGRSKLCGNADGNFTAAAKVVRLRGHPAEAQGCEAASARATPAARAAACRCMVICKPDGLFRNLVGGHSSRERGAPACRVVLLLPASRIGSRDRLGAHSIASSASCGTAGPHDRATRRPTEPSSASWPARATSSSRKWCASKSGRSPRASDRPSQAAAAPPAPPPQPGKPAGTARQSCAGASTMAAEQHDGQLDNAADDKQEVAVRR